MSTQCSPASVWYIPLFSIALVLIKSLPYLTFYMGFVLLLNEMPTTWKHLVQILTPNTVNIIINTFNIIILLRLWVCFLWFISYFTVNCLFCMHQHAISIFTMYKTANPLQLLSLSSWICIPSSRAIGNQHRTKIQWDTREGCSHNAEENVRLNTSVVTVCEQILASLMITPIWNLTNNKGIIYLFMHKLFYQISTSLSAIIMT